MLKFFGSMAGKYVSVPWRSVVGLQSYALNVVTVTRRLDGCFVKGEFHHFAVN
jgi:hypothetical protein